MTFGEVHASYSIPEWQAVKLTFFAPWWVGKLMKFISLGLPFSFRQENKKQSRKLCLDEIGPMCDKILLVVGHNDQTDQIFTTTIAPLLAAFLHTFQCWQRLFHHYIHGSIYWCSILHVRLCIMSWATPTSWSGWFVCIAGIARWVILREGYSKRDSHQISDLPEVGISAILYSMFLLLVLFQSNNFIYKNNHNNKDWSKVTL